MACSVTWAATFASCIVPLVGGCRKKKEILFWVLFECYWYDVQMTALCYFLSLWLFSFFLPNPGDVPGWLPSSRHWRREYVETSARVQQKLSVVCFFAPSMTKLRQKLTEEQSVGRKSMTLRVIKDNFPTGDITRGMKSVRSVKGAHFLCFMHFVILWFSRCMQAENKW